MWTERPWSGAVSRVLGQEPWLSRLAWLTCGWLGRPVRGCSQCSALGRVRWRSSVTHVRGGENIDINKRSWASCCLVGHCLISVLWGDSESPHGSTVVSTGWFLLLSRVEVGFHTIINNCSRLHGSLVAASYSRVLWDSYAIIKVLTDWSSCSYNPRKHCL